MTRGIKGPDTQLITLRVPTAQVDLVKALADLTKTTPSDIFRGFIQQAIQPLIEKPETVEKTIGGVRLTTTAEDATFVDAISNLRKARLSPPSFE